MAVRRPSPCTLASGVALGVAGVRPRTIVARALPPRVRTSTRPSLLALPKHHAHRVVPALSQTTTIPSRRLRSVNSVPPEALATVVDPFGVSPEQWELIEGNLFGASLLPYLAFLYFLQMPECRMPPRALFGFKSSSSSSGRSRDIRQAAVRHPGIGLAQSLEVVVDRNHIVVGMREGLQRRGNGGSATTSADGNPSTDSVGGAILGGGREPRRRSRSLPRRTASARQPSGGAGAVALVALRRRTRGPGSLRRGSSTSPRSSSGSSRWA